MADRIHPEPPSTAAQPPPPNPKPRAPSGTYVIQIPKDQIYRIPPPENASLYEAYTRRATSGSRRRRPCHFLLTALLSFLFLASLLVAVAGLAYLLLRPKLISLSVDRLAFSALNFSSPPPLSPKIDAILRVSNPNSKIAVRYLPGGSISLSYAGVPLAAGDWPAFSQESDNITVLEMGLVGQEFRPTDTMRKAMEAETRRAKVPVEITMTAPVKFRAGGVSTWKIGVRVRCEVVVDRLTTVAKIVDQQCDAEVDF